MDSWMIIDVGINMGRMDLAKMRDSQLEREVPTGVEEDHDDVNEADILGFTDDAIEFQVHNRGDGTQC
jgi:hypothetical protein